MQFNSPLVMLVAGSSQRMGTPKGILKVTDQEYWLEHQINKYFAMGGKEIGLVFGAHFAKYQEALSWLTSAEGEVNLGEGNVRWCFHQGWQQGQFSSLLQGLALFEHQKYPLFISPIDVPLPNSNTFASLLKKMDPEVKVCVPCFKSERGHPLLLSSDYVNLLLHRVDKDSGRLDQEIKKLPKEHVKEVSVSDDRILLNLNYPIDWENYKTWKPS